MVTKFWRMFLQTSDLVKQIEELKKSLNKDSVEQALREVKEYAARSSELNVDSLQIKLMHLDEVARRASHESRELYALTLQRFLCHKNNPNIGFLITSLLSSPAESKLFEKEQKFLKLHGKGSQSLKSDSKQDKEKEKEKKNTSDQEKQSANSFTPHFFPGMMPFPSRWGYPPFPRYQGAPRRGVNRTPHRFMNTGATSGCWKCGDPTHFQASCDKK